MARGFFVSPHAILRYQQRVEAVSDEQAHDALCSATVKIADSFGAPYVRLSGGQRIVVEEGTVVTVLPADKPAYKLRPLRPMGSDND